MPLSPHRSVTDAHLPLWTGPLWQLPGAEDGEPGKARDEALRAPRVHGARPVVLFADDNADARELYAFYLASQGYRVELASDGMEALDKVRTVRPDILLTDLSMPGLDGWELTRLLKSASTTVRMPIVVLTAHSHSSDRARAYAAGCDAFLVKPISTGMLARTIAEHLDPHRDV